MRKLLIIISYLSITLGWSQVDINDAGLQQCFTNNYPTFLSSSTQIDTSITRYQNGSIDCQGYEIKNISALVEFSNLEELTLTNLNTGDLSPIMELDSLNRLNIWDSDVDTLPNLSDLSNLEYLKIERTGLKQFPTVPTTIKNINLSDNELTETELTEKYNDLTHLTLTNNLLSKIKGLRNIPIVKTLLLGVNQITTFESFEFNDSLEILRLHNNPRQTPLLGLENKPNLKIINVANMGLEELPTLSFEPTTEYKIALNKFTFEDLLPLKSYSIFPSAFTEYEKQHYQGITQTLNLRAYESWEWNLDFDQDIENNYYLWYKDNILIDSSLIGLFTIEQLEIADAGVYRCEVKNTELPEVTINVNAITLTVTNNDMEEEFYSFSPDGDGINDRFHIRETGSIQLIDETGRFVKDLSGPAYWDGTDYQGNYLPFGYYIIIINGKTEYGITIVK